MDADLDATSMSSPGTRQGTPTRHLWTPGPPHRAAPLNLGSRSRVTAAWLLLSHAIGGARGRHRSAETAPFVEIQHRRLALPQIVHSSPLGAPSVVSRYCFGLKRQPASGGAASLRIADLRSGEMVRRSWRKLGALRSLSYAALLLTIDLGYGLEPFAAPCENLLDGPCEHNGPATRSGRFCLWSCWR